MQHANRHVLTIGDSNVTLNAGAFFVEGFEEDDGEPGRPRRKEYMRALKRKFEEYAKFSLCDAVFVDGNHGHPYPYAEVQNLRHGPKLGVALDSSCKLN